MKKAIYPSLLSICFNTPISIYYAFKQSETKGRKISSSGWQAFLQAIMDSGLSITGHMANEYRKGGAICRIGTNALASSIVLICRKKILDTQSISRKDFMRDLSLTFPMKLIL
jgi:putative DNA methylase